MVSKGTQRTIRRWIKQTMASVIGEPLPYALATLDEQEMPYRIVSVDGTPKIITHDFVPHRANLVIEDGVVVDCYGG